LPDQFNNNNAGRPIAAAGFFADRFRKLAVNCHLSDGLNLFNLLNDERLSTPYW